MGWAVNDSSSFPDCVIATLSLRFAKLLALQKGFRRLISSLRTEGHKSRVTLGAMAKKAKTSGKRVGERGRARPSRDNANGLAALTVKTERQAWFTPETLAAYLQVSDRQVRNWVSEGLLASYKIGSSRRFDPADVDAFVAQFRDEGKPKR
jgi:excisionase family DNA binding protein